ncbi:MCE family protein [Nocardioides rubriscoriae]|uniref:MCE family protein n=1 Tax=Nocardioides rubriscoriae TaxID=642762 RepID=UPI0011E010F5|nr:MlaD family protein [Nocardioides rubriscoriae]
MITRRTKVQLLVFVIITLLGVSFVGARYARLDEKVRDTTFEVTAHFAEAGGIFAGAEVTYRGVGIGIVDRLELTQDGVDVVLKIDDKWDDIPSQSIASVGNRSAVGEQFVELQPKVDDGPVLEQGSEIPVVDTRTPIATETILADLSDTVSSVDQDALRTTVGELGKAFDGTGQDLQQIIDTGSSFIQTADDNFDITTKLIEDSNTVLNTQIDSQSDLRTFADQLSLFSGTLADADPDLRKLIDDGSFAANQLRTFIEDNRIDLGSLLNNLRTNGETVVKHLDGIQQVLVVYPYVVEGGFTVVSKSPGTGKFDAHFGAIITDTVPCTNGYQSTHRRTPQERFTDPGMNVNARCADPASKSNPRGSQNVPPRVGTSFARPDAFYDPDTGTITYPDASDPDPAAPWDAAGTVAPRSLGKESWKWLYLEPMTGQ